VRIGIDARKLHDFGIGTYIRNLLKQLARLDQTTEYVLLTRESDLPVASQLGPNFRSVLEPSPNYSLREQLHVPWVLMREKPDVFHAPHYILPTGVRARCSSRAAERRRTALAWPHGVALRTRRVTAAFARVSRAACGTLLSGSARGRFAIPIR